jgi:hypothetical protein
MPDKRVSEMSDDEVRALAGAAPDNRLAAALDEIRGRWAQVDYVVLRPEVLPEPGPAPYRLPDVTHLLTAVDEVLKLHVAAVIEDARPPFRYCSRCSGHPAWPCPEVQAISRALLGEDGS